MANLQQQAAPKTLFSTLAAYMEGARVARTMGAYYDDQGNWICPEQARGETLMAMARNIRAATWMPGTENAARALANALEKQAASWLAEAQREIE